MEMLYYKFLHPDGEATVVPTVSGDVPKHSYSCRVSATGHCMSGDKCQIHHGARKETVHNVSEAGPSVFTISEADLSIQDEPSCVGPKIESPPVSTIPQKLMLRSIDMCNQSLKLRGYWCSLFSTLDLGRCCCIWRDRPLGFFHDHRS